MDKSRRAGSYRKKESLKRKSRNNHGRRGWTGKIVQARVRSHKKKRVDGGRKGRKRQGLQEASTTKGGSKKKGRGSSFDLARLNGLELEKGNKSEVPEEGPQIKRGTGLPYSENIAADLGGEGGEKKWRKKDNCQIRSWREIYKTGY